MGIVEWLLGYKGKQGVGIVWDKLLDDQSSDFIFEDWEDDLQKRLFWCYWWDEKEKNRWIRRREGMHDLYEKFYWIHVISIYQDFFFSTISRFLSLWKVYQFVAQWFRTEQEYTCTCNCKKETLIGCKCFEGTNSAAKGGKNKRSAIDWLLYSLPGGIRAQRVL